MLHYDSQSVQLIDGCCAAKVKKPRAVAEALATLKIGRDHAENCQHIDFAVSPSRTAGPKKDLTLTYD